MRRVLVVSLLLLPGVARADQIFTRGGGQLSGDVVERGPDSIVVDIGGGTIGLPLSYVERIVPGPSPLTLYREKSGRLAPDDAPGWVALGQWARQEGLRDQAREAFGRAIALDPDNAAAHEALGHVRVGPKWMAGEDGYRAQGLVRHEGEWMTPEDRRVRVAERAAAAEQAQAEADALARVREAEARARQAEAQARIAEAAARVAEVDARRTEFASLGMQWQPVGAGLTSVSFGRLPACRRRPVYVVRQGLLVPLAGRGGAFVTAEDLRATFRR